MKAAHFFLLALFIFSLVGAFSYWPEKPWFFGITIVCAVIDTYMVWEALDGSD